jgi:hypothetical protein
MEYSLKDKIILRIALITTIIGLIALFALMFFKTQEFISITDADNFKDRKVSLIGYATNFSYNNNNTRFILKQECSIEVIAFNERINASKIIVSGKIQEYNGKNTMIADKIFQVK